MSLMSLMQDVIYLTAEICIKVAISDFNTTFNRLNLNSEECKNTFFTV